MTIAANTKKAITKRLNANEREFFLGAYFYRAVHNGPIYRREQCCGYTPTSDWERVGTWKYLTDEVDFD